MDIVAGCAVERAGSGEPLVLLHGIGSRRQVWDPVLPALTASRDVLAVDLPGFAAASGLPATVRREVAGRTANRFPPGSVPALADAVEALCAALDLDRPHVAGSSLGGAVALELGRRGAARSVVAFSPAGFWGRSGRVWCQSLVRTARAAGRAVPERAVRTLAGTPVARPLLFGAFSAHPKRAGADALAADCAALVASTGFAEAARAFADLDWERELGPGGPGRAGLDRIPVVVAWGTRDVVLPYRPQAARAWRLLPAASHRPLAGCGHIPFADDPQACVAALLAVGAPVGPRRDD